MQKYKYIANLDVDEIIVPKNMSTWSEMMKALLKQTKNIEVSEGLKNKVGNFP